MAAYYNEIDPFAAAWLRELINAGHIAPGDVDTRSIVDVNPSDLRGYTQCHFFAGIAGWSLALRLAGWPDDRPIWTGSCPCQPYSLAGKRRGQKDERDLWPDWFSLVAAEHPAVVMGEQVKDAIGKLWLDRLQTDMEAAGYAVGAAVLPACSIGASHKRDRLWFIADTSGNGQQGECDGGNPGPAPYNGPRREAGRTFTPHAPYSQRREWSLDRPAGRVGREDLISWNGDWEVAPEPFVRRGTHGIPARMDQLRAYGNAIVPPLAAEVIGAYLDAERVRLTGVFA